MQSLPDIRAVHIRAPAPISALNDTAIEQEDLLLAHEITTCVRRIASHQPTLETVLMAFTPCTRPAPFESFDKYEAAVPRDWLKAVLFHRVDIKRYRNSAAIVTCRRGTSLDRHEFLK